MSKCAICKKLKPIHLSVVVNGVNYDHCEDCWNKERQKFLALLAQNDPKAKEILDRVVMAFEGGRGGDANIPS